MNLIAPSGHAWLHSGQKTHAPRSTVNGFKEMACVGHRSTYAEQASVQCEESSFGLPRNLSGTDAAIMSAITGCPSAKRTVTALGARNFICIHSSSEECGKSPKAFCGDPLSRATIRVFFVCKRVALVRFASGVLFAGRSSDTDLLGAAASSSVK